MIRQFLETTVENLRSFFVSLSRGGPERGASQAEPNSDHRSIGPRYPGASLSGRLTDSYYLDDYVDDYVDDYDDADLEDDPDYVPHPEAGRRTRNRGLPGSGAPKPPNRATQRRRLRAAGLLPAPAVDTGPEPKTHPEPAATAPENEAPRGTPTEQVDAATSRDAGYQVDADAAEADESQSDAPQADAPQTRRRPARPPHLFPTQSVPAQPSTPGDEIPEDEIPAEERAPQSDEELPEPIGDESPQGIVDQEFNQLHAVLESLLFVSGEPVGAGQLARVLDMEQEAVVEALNALAHIYTTQNRGLRLQMHRDKYQIVTAPAAAEHIERLLNLDTSSKLSGPALETLAVVAYRQPVARSQIEAVRGVDCAAVLRSLVQRGLVEEVGRLDVPGRPILYGVTEFFMQHFGITDLGDLPPLEQTEADTLWAATALAELEARSD